jgi:hypothetical protein
VQKPHFAIIALASALLLSGCGSEISPQEKRNLYDKCVLDYIAENRSASIAVMQYVEKEAPFQCRHLLG